MQTHRIAFPFGNILGADFLGLQCQIPGDAQHCLGAAIGDKGIQQCLIAIGRFDEDLGLEFASRALLERVDAPPPTLEQMLAEAAQ